MKEPVFKLIEALEEEKEKRKVVFCIPTYPFKPRQETLDSVRDSVPLLEERGWEHGMVSEIGNPYISAARAAMLRKALDAKATHIMFIDQDVSWEPAALLKVLDAKGGMVAGTYRFKCDKETYMGYPLTDAEGRPANIREDGAIAAISAPAGFLKVERWAISLLMQKFPELVYGETCAPQFDLFNHGAYKGIWWGEDYACSRRWGEIGEQLWIVPDINVAHHSSDKAYPGNYHKYLLRRPGGSESANPVQPVMGTFKVLP